MRKIPAMYALGHCSYGSAKVSNHLPEKVNHLVVNNHKTDLEQIRKWISTMKT
ncbi:MAG: hypothetical protein ACOCXH_09750 [Cyclobacteriaceae bacterium]